MRYYKRCYEILPDTSRGYELLPATSRCYFEQLLLFVLAGTRSPVAIHKIGI